MYSVAKTADEVLEAWGLVYRSYRRAGLIEPNDTDIHTVPEAIGPRSIVVLGRIRSVVASTLSTYADGPQGLPLDKVYGDELARLRDQGRSLSEVGLFADRREAMDRSIYALFSLMRFAYYYAIHSGCDDILIGVHPRHAAFYSRLIGFEPIAEERTYAAVNDHPVVLMRLDLRETPRQRRLPKGLKHFHDQPLGPEAFADRFAFPAWAIDRPELRGYRFACDPAATD